MAAEPQDFEPEKLTAGVTWKWKKTHSDYPASEWTLTYYLRKDGATATSFTGTADEDSFLVTVAASTTSSYAAGVYDFIGVVSKTAEKFIVFDGVLKVHEDRSLQRRRDHSRGEGHGEMGLEEVDIGTGGSVIEGVVDQITEYGAFVRFGPLDGLLHVSQVQDDHINTDVGNQRLVGKESKRELRVGDKVRARVVTISLNEISPRESKIGLTMRQPGLGKHEWIIEDQNKAAAGGE